MTEITDKPRHMLEPISPFPPNWAAIDHAISMLNWTLQHSPKNFQTLLETWVVAPQQWVDSKQLQCCDEVSWGTNCQVLRTLGLINGLFGAGPSGYGYIAAVYDEESLELVAFRRMEPMYLGLNEDYTLPTDDPARGGQ